MTCMTSCFLMNPGRTKSGNVVLTLELLFCLSFLSYMLVDNFQRGIFKWPLVFGWSPVPDEYIKKHNMTISDPIRYLKTVSFFRGMFSFYICCMLIDLFHGADVRSWLEAFSP